MKKFLFLITLASGCIEPFNLDFEKKSSGLYFVDGEITDHSPVSVYLGEAATFSDPQGYSYIDDAQVTLYDNLGNSELLTHQKDGYYTGFEIGKIGRSYHIEIKLPNEKTIISSPEFLKPGASVGTLSKAQSNRYKISSVGENLPVYGLDINLLMDEKDTLSRFYRWTFNQTYKVFTPRDPNAAPCYVTSDINNYFILDESAYQARDIIARNLIFFESEEKFAFGYSLLVQQYALSKSAYDYWKKIDDQQNNVGSVFDAPPAQIVGNLSFADNESDPVLGYFEVTSVKSKRIFIEPTDFRKLPEPTWQSCFPRPDLEPYVRIPAWCFDCTALKNSSREKPSFWPN